MNPIPWFIGAFFAGFYIGWKAGQQAALEEEPATWEEVQRSVAADQ